jgi:hypothetical protein
VKEAFQRLVMLSTMAKPDNDQFELGPFARIITSVQVLEREVKSLRRSVQILENRAGDDIVKIDLSGIDQIDLNSSPYTVNIPHVAPLTHVDISALTGLNMNSMGGVETVTLTTDKYTYLDDITIKIDTESDSK